jgi:hypothetical protein
MRTTAARLRLSASIAYFAPVLVAMPLCQLEALFGKGAAVMCEAAPHQ